MVALAAIPIPCASRQLLLLFPFLALEPTTAKSVTAYYTSLLAFQIDALYLLNMQSNLLNLKPYWRTAKDKYGERYVCIT